MKTDPRVTEPDAAELIYDWNSPQPRGPLSPLRRHRKVTFFDETLRDGIQSPSVRDPSTRRQEGDPPS